MYIHYFLPSLVKKNTIRALAATRESMQSTVNSNNARLFAEAKKCVYVSLHVASHFTSNVESMFVHMFHLSHPDYLTNGWTATRPTWVDLMGSCSIDFHRIIFRMIQPTFIIGFGLGLTVFYRYSAIYFTGAVFSSFLF